jgi:hypothetical protein
MNDEQLKQLQAELFFEFGFKVDVYQSEFHRGILVVPHGQPLIFQNVIKVFNY